MKDYSKLRNVQYVFIQASNLHKQGKADKVVMSKDEYTGAAVCTRKAERIVGCLHQGARCHLAMFGFDFFHRRQQS